MRKVLIISPHFPPSNLAAVHRSRLFAKHLPVYNFEPIILTVHEKYYEEKLDYNLEKLLARQLVIEKVEAFAVTKPRLLGDIGLRGFFQLYEKAKDIIKKEKIVFLYIPIPSFYVALLGRLLHEKTGIRYGIDYIDPWVHTFPGSDRKFSRHWFSTQLAKILEPIAVKKASLITGVAEGYYEGVQRRNPSLAGRAIFAAMPYGGEVADHEKVIELNLKPYLFVKKNEKLQLVYAGAMLPKSYTVLEAIFSAIKDQKAIFKRLEIYFIGTGQTLLDKDVYNIKGLAEKYELWEDVVYEFPARIPYLDVLTHLEAADGAFILGSTEPHYTPSKIYQSVLSKKAIFAVLHTDSSACNILRNSKAGIVLNFSGELEVEKVNRCFASYFKQYLQYWGEYNYSNLDHKVFKMFSARELTGILAKQIDSIISAGE